MSRYENVGFWGSAGANFRDDLFGPVQRGRYGAFNDFLVDSQCVLLGALESGTRNAGLSPLANGWAFVRGFNGCYSGSPPAFQKELPENGYYGGQCEVTYDATFSIEMENGVQDNQQTAGMLGPIMGLRTNPNAFSKGVTSRVEYSRDGETWQAAGSGTVSPLNRAVSEPFNVVVTRRDGQPDDCGNGPQGQEVYPDGQELPPPPSDGDVIVPGRDIVVPVDVPGGTVDLGVNIGDATFCQDGSICVSVDGLPHRIRPDGGIDVAPDEPGASEPPSSDSSDIQDIKDALEVDIQGEFNWVNCEGEPMTSGYFGQGFGVVEAMFQTMLPLVNSGVFQYCGLLGSDEFQGNLLNTTSLPSSEIDVFSDVALNTATKKVVLDVMSTHPQYSIRRGSNGGNDDRQTRFAVVSFAYEVDGQECVSWTRNQYYSKGVYDIELISLDSREFRVSLKAGSTATIKEFA